MNKKELWLNIKHYHFDDLVPPNLLDKVVEFFGGKDASTKAFASKIARKLNWTNDFALYAVLEYKKFVYLGVVSDFAVTPSRIIDQVWHEHILFSSAYRTFCKEVIKNDFDHSPELIPMEEQTGIYDAQYNDTINLYTTEFGVEPPEIIWGSTKFDPKSIDKTLYESKKKKKTYADSGDSSFYPDEPPLVECFSYELSFDSSTDFSEFGGGDFGGGGANGSWSDSWSDGSDSSDGGGDGGGCSGGGCGGD